jgi:hypothetical protein
MQSSKLLPAILTLGLAVSALPQLAQAQYYTAVPARPAPNTFLLGSAHVDGPTDHDDIKVGRYAGRFHSIMLRVSNAPIQFDHVVIHYGNGTAEPLPVNAFIAAGGYSRWIVLPGRGDRVIASLELWYARADPRNPYKPEVELYGAP